MCFIVPVHASADVWPAALVTKPAAHAVHDVLPELELNEFFGQTVCANRRFERQGSECARRRRFFDGAPVTVLVQGATVLKPVSLK